MTRSRVRAEDAHHAAVWRWIDDMARRQQVSPCGLAKLAGLDPTSFNRSKRIGPKGKPRWPSTETIAAVLTVTGTTWLGFGTITHTAFHHAAEVERASL